MRNKPEFPVVVIHSDSVSFYDSEIRMSRVPTKSFAKKFLHAQVFDISNKTFRIESVTFSHKTRIPPFNTQGWSVEFSYINEDSPLSIAHVKDLVIQDLTEMRESIEASGEEFSIMVERTRSANTYAELARLMQYE